MLRMKNFNILGVHWKIRLLREGGGSQKTNTEGGDCVFEGRVETPMHTMPFTEVATFFVALHLPSQHNFVSGISNVKDSYSSRSMLSLLQLLLQ